MRIGRIIALSMKAVSTSIVGLGRESGNTGAILSRSSVSFSIYPWLGAGDAEDGLQLLEKVQCGRASGRTGELDGRRPVRKS